MTGFSRSLYCSPATLISRHDRISHREYAMEIIPGIHQVDGVRGNCYILVRDGLIVIDTGLPGSGKKIFAYIRNRLHRDPAEVRTIIITHFHLDHTGGLAAVKRVATGAKVAVGSEDAGVVEGTLPAPVPPGLKGLLMRFFSFIVRPGHLSPDILLKDGDRIEGLICISLPGHTPGSIGLLDEMSRAFFCGDILRSDGLLVTGGPIQFTMDRVREHESRRRIAGLDFEILLPGHGVPLVNGASAKVRNFVREDESKGQFG
jgi:glyoxylase-like metal-dependent hydrolase (beta-lactamase superfamily II)